MATAERFNIFSRSHSPLDPQSRKIYLILESSHLLSLFLSFLEWDNFYALLNACKRYQLLFEDAALRDVILSRYVPWYAHALRLRDPLGGYKDVPVSLKDLDLLLTSQRIPLHQYPIHARRTLTSLQPLSSVTSWLESLTHAHSRFVLLLQAYVHSSNDPLRAESEDVIWSSRSAPPSSQLRRLIFPPPLSYYAGNESRSPGSEGTTAPGQKARRSSRGRPDGSARSTSAALPSKKSRAFSFLRRSSLRLRVVATPEYPEPRTYSGYWKRASIVSQLSRDTTDYDEGWISYSRQRVISKGISNDSFRSGTGSSSSPRSTSRGSLFPSTATNSSTGSITGNSSITSPSFSSRPQSVVHQLFSSGHTSHPMKMTSPLDISFAVSRARAPILRIFVPCSDHQGISQELLLCEQQLVDAGLWDHLSAGDLICNLGYVAAEGDDVGAPSSTSSDGDLRASPRRDPTRRSENRHQKRQSNSFVHYHWRPAHSRRWLLFNGRFLEPHKPPQAVRLPDPLSLPTPFYYMHIMPPYTNPVYIIDGFGLGDVENIQLETRLVCTTMRVQSPHSPTGYALARKYVWTAWLLRSPIFFDHNAGQRPRYIGDGWIGEWVLEGEGTKEGRDILLDCIRGQITGPVEWEVVVERCGGGRVWLRLLGNLSRTKDLHNRTTI